MDRERNREWGIFLGYEFNRDLDWEINKENTQGNEWQG